MDVSRTPPWSEFSDDIPRTAYAPLLVARRDKNNPRGSAIYNIIYWEPGTSLSGRWVREDGSPCLFKPTHWMPLAWLELPPA